MTRRLLLVRHAYPAADWNASADSGLDATGDAQARALIDVLGSGGPRPLVVSPLRRTRATAAPLARHWGLEPTIEPAVGEIPAPTPDPEARGAWLREVLDGRWSDAGPEVAQWRSLLLETLVGMADGTVVVSHFVAINAAVGAATGTDRIVTFSPAHCSRTELEVVDGALRVVALGGEARTQVR